MVLQSWTSNQNKYEESLEKAQYTRVSSKGTVHTVDDKRQKKTKPVSGKEEGRLLNELAMYIRMSRHRLNEVGDIINTGKLTEEQKTEAKDALDSALKGIEVGYKYVTYPLAAKIASQTTKQFIELKALEYQAEYLKEYIDV